MPCTPQCENARRDAFTFPCSCFSLLVHVSLLVFFPPCPPTWWRHVTAHPGDSLCACAGGGGGVARCACAQSDFRGFLEAERRLLVVDWRLGDGWRRPGTWRLKLRVVLAGGPSRGSPSYQTAPLPSQERLLEENMSPDWSFLFFSMRRPSRPDGLDLRQRVWGGCVHVCLRIEQTFCPSVSPPALI